jgi:hypothetical protein
MNKDITRLLEPLSEHVRVIALVLESIAVSNDES